MSKEELYEKVIELEEENKLLREQLKAKQAIPYYVPIYPYTNPIYPPTYCFTDKVTCVDSSTSGISSTITSC